MEMQIPFAGAANDLMLKLFGPTAEYFGESMRRHFEDRGQRNLERAVVRAIARLGDDIQSPGEIPPRVLKGFLEEAPFCEDDVSVDYVSGVLASSRSTTGDDRGASQMATISRLSSLALRAHYIWYSAIGAVFRGNTTDIRDDNQVIKLWIFMPLESYLRALGIEEHDEERSLGHILRSLARDNLIRWRSTGPASNLQESLKSKGDNLPDVPDDGMLIGPTPDGIELYMWSLGWGQKYLEYLISDDPLPTIPGVPVPTDCKSIRSLFPAADELADQSYGPLTERGGDS
jgi:hypothetical protein